MSFYSVSILKLTVIESLRSETDVPEKTGAMLTPGTLIQGSVVGKQPLLQETLPRCPVPQGAVDQNQVPGEHPKSVLKCFKRRLQPLY